MRKNFIKIIFKAVILFTVLISLVISTSCNKKNSENAEIQLWYYSYGPGFGYEQNIKYLAKDIKNFCDRNNIPLKVMGYDEKVLSYEDYVLKRNLATIDGNMIIIEGVDNMWDISEKHADYTKLKHYNKIFDEHKDKYCIPLGICNAYQVVNRDILDYYDIKLDKSIITYDEYLNIKQELKEKGAKFYLNPNEYNEILYYYINKHDLLYVNNTSDIYKDEEKLKSSLKSAIIEICEDYITYKDRNKLDSDEINNRDSENIIDENSNLRIYAKNARGPIALAAYSSFNEDYESIKNNILVVGKYCPQSPSFYMDKKITNERIWEVANYIVSDSGYESVSKSNHGVVVYSPIMSTEITNKVLGFNESLEYVGIFKDEVANGVEKYIHIYKLIDEVYERTVKDEEMRKILAKYVYSDSNYRAKIVPFVSKTVRKLSESGFDYNNETLNKSLDEDINEFIKNLHIINN